MIVVFCLGEQYVCQKENLQNGQVIKIECILWKLLLIMYLSCSKCQRSSKEEIGIRRTSVDPQIPKDGTKNRSYQENTANDERVPKNWGKSLFFCY